MNVEGNGVFIIGPPAIGKSSLALELLAQGCQLIADDVVDFYVVNDRVTGQCPPMLAGLLHSRELGFISVNAAFSDRAWQEEHHVDYVVKLTRHTNQTLEKQTYVILNKPFPQLTLSVTNPASLFTRLLCWLNMQANPQLAENEIKQRQHSLMSIAK